MLNPAVATILSAPWWPEFLRVKDTLSWMSLALRFGVREPHLRAALDEAGLTKIPVPPGRKPRVEAVVQDASPAEPTPPDILRDQAGKRPDGDVAEAAGVTVEQVKAYRKDHAIKAFLRPPPGTQHVHQQPLQMPMPVESPSRGAAVVLRRTSTGEREREVRTETLLPTAPAPTTTPPVTSLEAFRAELGTVSDQVIAERAGVDRAVVGAYRRSLGVAAYTGFRWGPGQTAPRRASTTPTTPAPAAVAKTRSGSAIDAFADLLGTMPDSAIAAMAGVTGDAVKHYRRHRGIDRYVAPARSAPEQAPAVTAPTEPERIPAAPPPDAVNPLEAFRDDLGTVADQVIADLAGVHHAVVGRYRRKLGIKAYTGFRWVAGQAPPPRTGSAPATAATPVVVEVAPVVVDAAVVTVPESAQSAPNEIKRLPGRPSKIDPFASRVGIDPDHVVAALAGSSAKKVAAWRERRGIAAPVAVVAEHAVSVMEHAVEVVVAPVSAPIVEPAVEAAVAAPVAPVLSDIAAIEEVPLATGVTPRSEPVSAKLLPFVHLLGVETDRAIGKRAGIPLWSVRAWRVRKGIPAAPLGARAREEKVVPDAQPAVVEPPVASMEIERELVSDVGVIEPVDASAAHDEPEPDVPCRVAYRVRAVSGERTQDFVVVAADFAEAAVVAADALGRRRDGPWRVTAMRELLEALE